MKTIDQELEEVHDLGLDVVDADRVRAQDRDGILKGDQEKTRGETE